MNIQSLNIYSGQINFQENKKVLIQNSVEEVLSYVEQGYNAQQISKMMGVPILEIKKIISSSLFKALRYDSAKRSREILNKTNEKKNSDLVLINNLIEKIGIDKASVILNLKL